MRKLMLLALILCCAATPVHADQTKHPDVADITVNWDFTQEELDAFQRDIDLYNKTLDTPLYKWSLEEKAELYPDHYKVPGPENMQADEALNFTIEVLLETYDISEEDLTPYTPYFWYSLETDAGGNPFHRYRVEFADDVMGYPVIYGVVFNADTLEILEVNFVEDPTNEPVG